MRIRAGPAPVRRNRKRTTAIIAAQIGWFGRAASAVGRTPPITGRAAQVCCAPATTPVVRRRPVARALQPGELVSVRGAGLRPVTRAAGRGQTRPSGWITAPGHPAIPAVGVRFRCLLDPRPRADIPFQIGARRARPVRR